MRSFLFQFGQDFADQIDGLATYDMTAYGLDEKRFTA